MKCPSCNSEDTKRIARGFPEAYECNKCKITFLKTPNALIDE